MSYDCVVNFLFFLLWFKICDFAPNLYRIDSLMICFIKKRKEKESLIIHKAYNFWGFFKKRWMRSRDWKDSNGNESNSLVLLNDNHEVKMSDFVSVFFFFNDFVQTCKYNILIANVAWRISFNCWSLSDTFVCKELVVKFVLF